MPVVVVSITTRGSLSIYTPVDIYIILRMKIDVVLTRMVTQRAAGRHFSFRAAKVLRPAHLADGQVEVTNAREVAVDSLFPTCRLAVVGRPLHHALVTDRDAASGVREVDGRDHLVTDLVAPRYLAVLRVEVLWPAY